VDSNANVSERQSHWQRLSAVMQRHFWTAWPYPTTGWQRFRWSATSTGHPYVRVGRTTFFLVHREAPADFEREIVLAFRLGHVTAITPAVIDEGDDDKAIGLPPLVEIRERLN
jgi:hypothetical protein